ncbi:CLUMA_CG011506, isoform A [Clunio marinus]|uniref:CLUMA_CG011506, isoform A n=1 Tax=Clunio marinus TaxID=568069 RepID=A0A1J1IEE1_9DIPT|nr:CLUMA_CG011506, isoform A [Clunio marinus]
MENLEQEIAALNRKLHSKNEALKIMRSELECFRTERDQFKLMAETIQLRYCAMKNGLESSGRDLTNGSTSSTIELFITQNKEKNIILQTETGLLRQKLQELQGDLKLLRNKNNNNTQLNKKKAIVFNIENEETLKSWNEEKSKLIDQLEGLKKKNAHLQFDFRSLLDEKEEIVNERDSLKCKIHQLNQELNSALKGKGSIDIGSLVMENKSLCGRIEILEQQLESLKQSNEKLQQSVRTEIVQTVTQI